MSSSRLIESWEHGQDRDPPVLVTSLSPDEHLLWAVRLRSIATVGWHYRLAAAYLVFACLFLFFVPWGESVDQYCGPNQGRCLALYYMTWPAFGFVAGAGLLELWTGWRAGHGTWVIAYAISTKRAFLIDERRPKDFRYIYLRLHQAQIEGSGILGFAEERQKFVGLDYGSLMRAFYWATEGRQDFVKIQMDEPNDRNS